MIADGATSGKFDVIPVKMKSDRSGYEFDASKKTEAAYDVAADKLADTIGRDPTMKAVASNSDASAAEAAAKTALTPSVVITAFNNGSSTRADYAVADGATSNDGKLYLKFTLSDSSTDFVVGDITVTGGTLSNFTGSRTDYTAEFTPSGSTKVDTTINVAKDKFTNDYFGNTAATEFNWKYDPDNGLEDGDIVKEIDSNGDPTGKFLLLDIEATNTPTIYTLTPVKKDGSNWIYESANAGSKAAGYGLSDLSLAREIGPKPTGQGESVSDSAALTILKAAGVMVSIHGDEKGGSKAFSAGTHDASNSLSSPDSDGIGWILKGVKAFGETTTSKAEVNGRPDVDFFALINSPSTPKLTNGQKYKITVVKEAWDGSDNGKVIDAFKVLNEPNPVKTATLTKDEATIKEFTADGSDYFLQILGKSGEDAQYSVFLDIV